MQRLRQRAEKLARLSPQDRWALAQAVAALPLVTLALRRYGWQRVQRELARIPQGRPRGAGGDEQADCLADVVAIASHRGLLPGTCLSRSLLLWLLLRRHGLDSEIRVGVGESLSFDAHAWVEFRGRALGGDGKRAARYGDIARANSGVVRPA